MAATDRQTGYNSELAIKAPCVVATTANITLSGTQTIDGVAVVALDRVLVKNQTDGTENGIYVVDATSWERAVDFNKNTDIVHGTLVYVHSGTTNTGSWRVTTSDPITIDSSSIAFSVSGLTTEVSAFMATVLNDADEATARATLGAASESSVVKVLDSDTTTYTFSNTTTRTNIYTFSVPANTLGTDGMLRLTLMGKCLNTTGTAKSALIGLGYGTVDNIRGTTIGGIDVPDTDGADFCIHLDLFAKGATNAQNAFARIDNGSSSARQNAVPFLEQSGSGGNFILVKHEALAVDSTAAQTLYVSVKLSAADANLSCSMLNARLEALG